MWCASTSIRCVARALDDLAPAIRRRCRPWKRQRLHAVVSLSNLRQSNLDRRAADRDAINPVANVGLRGGTIWEEQTPTCRWSGPSSGAHWDSPGSAEAEGAVGTEIETEI